MNLREEIYRLVYNHIEEQYGKCEECEYRTDLIIKIIEKRIDEIQDIKNLKPAESPQDVIYNAGVWDGIGKVKEMLK